MQLLRCSHWDISVVMQLRVFCVDARAFLGGYYKAKLLAEI